MGKLLLRNGDPEVEVSLMIVVRGKKQERISKTVNKLRITEIFDRLYFHMNLFNDR